MPVLKPKKCKNCGELFTPYRPLSQVCSIFCAAGLSKKQREAKEKKEYRVWKKEKIESLKTHKDYLKELQTVFNTYIRLRDINSGCITCGQNLSKIKFDAGHFYSVGSTPALRFHEDNVHGQCVHCNQHLHGRLIDYMDKLPIRIGQERFELLKSKKNDVTKYSITELKAKIGHYKSQVKILNERN